MKRTLSLLLLIAFSSCTPISDSFFDEEPNVRVLLIHTLDQIELRPSAKAVFFSKAEKHTVVPGLDDTYLLQRSRNGITVSRSDTGEEIFFADSLWFRSDEPFYILDVPYGIGWWWGGREDRIYEGKLHLYPNDKDALDAVLHLPLEACVKGVIPYEIGPDSPLEALKAQAVAARSEIAQALLTDKYRTATYDLCADVECQVFAGNARRSARSDSAVVLTQAQILMYGDEIADAYYASNCGGMSERVEKVWPWRSGPKPYIVASYDVEEEIKQADLLIDPQTDIKKWLEHPPASWCNPDIHAVLPEWSRANFRWERVVMPEDFEKEFRGTDSLEVVERGESGRLHQVNVWKKGEKQVLDYELAIRQMIHPPLRSSAFIWSKTDTAWVFHGAGWGHGVGMCQSGAISQAHQGRDYVRILSHYFPGTRLQPLYSSTR